MADPAFISILRDCPVSVAADGVTVAMGAGLFYLPSGVRVRSAGATATIPTGAVAGWLHMYSYVGANGRAALELSATTPAVAYMGTARTKTGDTSRRYVGSCLYSGSKLRMASHRQANAVGSLTTFQQSTSTFTTPLELKSWATAPSAVTEVDASTVIPVTATAALLTIHNSSNWWLYVGRPSVGTTSRTVHQHAIPPASSATVLVDVDTNQKFSIAVGNLSVLGITVGLTLTLAGGILISAQGYLFDR